MSVENGPFLGSAGGTVLVFSGEDFDNDKGKMRLFVAGLYPKTDFPTGGGVLAKVTFKVVGEGCSLIDLGWDTGLMNAKGEWIIRGRENVKNGYFANAEVETMNFTPIQTSTASDSGTRGPYVDQHWWQVINSGDARLMALLTHDVDAGPILRPEDIRDLLDHGFTVTLATDLDMSVLAMNCRSPPLDDPELRQAIQRLINRDEIVDQFYTHSWTGISLVEKLNYWLPPGQAEWINPGAELPGYDPFGAAEILDAAGYVQGSTPNPDYDPELQWSAQYIRIDPNTGTDLALIEFLTSDDPIDTAATSRITRTINKIGIPTKLVRKTARGILREVMKLINIWWETFYGQSSEEEWQIAYGVSLEFDVEPILYEIFRSDQSWNIWGINNSALDYWCDRTRETLNGTEFKEAIYKIQELANELMPFVPMFASKRAMTYVGPEDPMTGWTGPGYIGIVNAPGNRRLCLRSSSRGPIRNRWIKMLGRRVTEGSSGWEPTNEWIIPESPDNLNPLWQYASYNWQVIDLIFDHLVERNPYTNNYFPWAAMDMPALTEWTGPAGEIGMTIEFELRKDMKWHDGELITAEDCVFALNLLKEQRVAPYHSTWQPIYDIEQTGPYSFKVYYLKRYLFAFGGISSVALLAPKHIWEPYIAGPDKQLWTDDDRHYRLWNGPEEVYMGNLTKLIGSGPFIYPYGGLEPGVSVNLTANRQYFGGRICPGDIDLEFYYNPTLPEGKRYYGIVDLADYIHILHARDHGSWTHRLPVDPIWDPAADIAPPAQVVTMAEILVWDNHMGDKWGPGYPPCP